MLKINQTLFQKAALPFSVGLLVFGSCMLLKALAFIPEQTFATTTGNATVSVGVQSVLTLTVSPDADQGQAVEITADNSAVKTGTFTAEVSSNQQYHIILTTKDDTTSLVNGGSTRDVIPAVSASNPIQAGKSAWGIRTCEVAANAAGYNCGTQVYRAIGSKNGSADTGNVFFTSNAGVDKKKTVFEVGISVGSNLSSGVYTNHVVVTASQF